MIVKLDDGLPKDAEVPKPSVKTRRRISLLPPCAFGAPVLLAGLACCSPGLFLPASVGRFAA